MIVSHLPVGSFDWWKIFDNKWEERFSKRLDDLTVKVLEHEDTIAGVTHQLEIMEQEVQRSLKN